MINVLTVSTHRHWVGRELNRLLKCGSPRLGALGHGPGQGDSDCALLVSHLSYEVDIGARSPDSLGMAWLHEVPYYPRHPHLARLLQESISAAGKIRYETGLSELGPDNSLVRGGMRSRAFKLARETARSRARHPVFIIVAQDQRKKEAVEIVRRELEQTVEDGKLTLIGTRGTINSIAENLWQDSLDRGWQPYELQFQQPIAEELRSVWTKCKRGCLNIISLGSKSGEGDLDISYYVRALGSLNKKPSEFWMGMIWLHSVPYEAGRLHYNLLLQESLTTANIPYATSIDGTVELLQDLRKWLRSSQKARSVRRAILATSADDSMKLALRFILREFRMELVNDNLIVIATSGTAALLKNLANRRFP